MKDEETRPKGLDEQADFVMSFVEDSADKREDMEEIWDEIESNYLVRPYTEQSYARDTSRPLRERSDTQNTGRAVLKDPETHQQVMTIVSAIVNSTMPEPGYVKTRPIGMEDTQRASTANALLEYTDRLPGAYQTNLEWVLSAGVWGLGIKEVLWDYIEEPRSFRSVEFDPDTGQELSTSDVYVAPVYDDVREEVFDVRDWFPDHSSNRTHTMLGGVRRFKITAGQARSRAESGVYGKAAVERAIESRAQHDAKEQEDHPGYNDVTDLTSVPEAHPDFMQLFGYRYCGTVPWDDDDGFQKREIVVISGETVRSEPWARRIPWFECMITPRLNSPWGISPGEVNRYDQDFADIMKMMLADAVVRMTHPPFIYNKQAEVDLAKLRAWRPSVPIGAMGDPNSAIGTAKYTPELAPMFNMYQGVKQQMRESFGALDANQGLGLGSKRFSASEAVGTFQAASQRPEMFANLMEREYMPAPAKYKIGLYQEFLEDTDDLRLRVGETNAAVVLSDILVDFDVEFVGTRIAGTKNDEIAAFREIIAAGANPALLPLIPWIPLFRKYLDKMGASEIAAMVGNPQLMQAYLALQQLTAGQPNAQSGNNNGTTPSNPAAALLPQQAIGGISS